MPALLTRSLPFLKQKPTVSKSPDENRASTPFEIDAFLRCLPPSPPPPSYQQQIHHGHGQGHNHSHSHNSQSHHHSPSTYSSSVTPTVILPPSPPPTDVPPVPPPSYNSLEKGYYTASTRPDARQRTSSREKNRSLNLRVETGMGSDRGVPPPMLVYPAPPAGGRGGC